MKHAALLLPLALALSAADRWSVDDVLLQERISAIEISKDGKLAVYVKSKMDKEKGEAVSNLCLKSIGETGEVTLTRGTDKNSAPKFSPDSKRIAFLSTRKPPAAPGGSGDEKEESKGPQVWLLDTRGGEPWPVTKLEKGVNNFEWLDDNTLLLAAAEDPALYEQKTKERKDTSQVVDDEVNEPPVRLFRLEIKCSKVTRVTSNQDRIAALFVSPDGQHAVTIHDRSLSYIFNQKIKPVAYLYDLKTGSGTQLFADGKLRLRDVEWARDSKSFYFVAPYTTDPVFENPVINLLYRYDLATAQSAQVELKWDNALSSGVSSTSDGFLALLAAGVHNKAAVYNPSGSGWTQHWIEGEHTDSLVDLKLAEDGKTILYCSSTASQPPKWYTARLDGSRLADPKLLVESTIAKDKPISKTEVVAWKGARDETVEGLLYYPHQYEAGKKYALVVMIHGGPFGHDADSFQESMAYPHQLMAQRGAFVFKPNYHGSSSYGLKWGESIANGNYNELEWIDVEKGVDSLIARGLVDPEKLGVMGWSNGSIITIELTTRTTRYKVAGAGAGDVNWLSDWGNAVFGHSFDAYYLGKTPMDDPSFYVKKSPLFRMDKVRTPTIIFFGTEDKQVPTEQGWQHFRALQHYGNTDVKFILFPGEAHGPKKYVHQRRKLDEELAWFDKYLFGTARDTNTALKPGSPLSAALQRAKLTEIPETVERPKLAVGRFEVTRSEYAAFDPSYAIAPGTANYPASGISFESAKAYCAWLSRKTGQTWRLPKEEELAEDSKTTPGDNTLDLWAGYPVNPDDQVKLSSLVEGLGPGALLKAVGSGPGSGDDPIYDLGGNVAEWTTAKDGSGKPLGGSADRPSDPKSQVSPRPDYIGFRVIRDMQ
jgi:dipeptidyl aminopeptidase/acylaminoacyl peptidase